MVFPVWFIPTKPWDLSFDKYLIPIGYAMSFHSKLNKAKTCYNTNLKNYKEIQF